MKTAWALTLAAALPVLASAAPAVDPPLVFHPSAAKPVEMLPVVSGPSRPWLSSTPDTLTIDLSGQWEPGARDQGRYGTCNAFAAVALAEAAYFRNAGQRLRLSEADLYLQANVLRWSCWSDPAQDCSRQMQGYSPARFAQYIAMQGILPGDDYQAFMSVLAQALDADHAAAQGRAQDESGVLQKLQSYADGRPGGPARARADVARRFAGYRLIFGHPRVIDDRWTVKAGTECAAGGAAAGRFIDGELLQGRPVAVVIYHEALPEWHNHTKGLNSAHAVVIDGLTLERVPSGIAKTYRTRNSWGGDNPPIKAEELCRVSEASSLLGPDEHEAPADPWAALEP